MTRRQSTQATKGEARAHPGALTASNSEEGAAGRAGVGLHSHQSTQGREVRSSRGSHKPAPLFAPINWRPLAAILIDIARNPGRLP